MLTDKEESKAISATKIDEVDGANVVNINKDKLLQVKDSEIVKACKALQKIDGEREEINARRSEIIARMKNLGIPTQAFNAAYARFKLGEEKRAEMDAAFAKCANAMGCGYQADLF